MNEMVERVARAICKANDYDPDANDNLLSGPSGTRNWHLYVTHARAAIAVMREPTQEMVESGVENAPNPRDIWEAMIDAALAEHDIPASPCGPAG